MKKLMAFLISTMIPAFVPMCILTVPVCIVEKHIPQELQDNFQYGMRFLQLVWGTGIETKPVQSAQNEEKPLVVFNSSNVRIVMDTNADVDSDSECEMAQEAIFAKSNFNAKTIDISAIAVANASDMALDHKLDMKIDAIMDRGFEQRELALAELNKLKNQNFGMKPEELNKIMQRTLQHVEIRLNQIPRAKKIDHRAIRFIRKNKSSV